MHSSFLRFKAILKDTRSSFVTYDYLSSINPPYDFSDILRWQWAQSVSALDKLIHDLIQIGMLQVISGVRRRTSKFENFSIDLNTYLAIKANMVNEINLMEALISRKNKANSYQDPDKIKDGLSLIWDEEYKWQKIAAQMHDTEQNLKTKLKMIVTRRNQIVHEGDYTEPGSVRQDIQRGDVCDVLNFIEKLGETIYNFCK